MCVIGDDDVCESSDTEVPSSVEPDTDGDGNGTLSDANSSSVANIYNRDICRNFCRYVTGRTFVGMFTIGTFDRIFVGML